MKKILTVFFISLLAFVLASCGPKPSLTVADTEKTFNLKIGETANVKPTVPEGFKLSWKSSDEAIATVTAAEDTLSAVIEAKSVGNATITVSIVNEAEFETIITVNVTKPEPASVTITGAGTIIMGETLQLTGTVTPSTALQNLVWVSDKNSVAIVDQTGKVTAVTPGTAKITATSAKATVKAEVTVTVVLPDPDGITVTGSDQIILGNAGTTYTVTVTPNLADKEVVWSVSDTSIATVDEAGVLTAVKVGTVTLRATSKVKDTIFGEKVVEVVLPNPTSVSITGPDLVMVGNTANYTSKVSPSLAVQTVTWSTSDANIATIDTNGVLTPVAAGTVKVVATSTVLNTVLFEKTVNIEVPVSVEFETNGGNWPISATYPFVYGTPLKSHTIKYYNADTALYLAVYPTSIFLQNNGKLVTSKWVNRICLDKNANGVYEVSAVYLAGTESAADMTVYDYVLVAHDGYSAGYKFLGGLTTGDLVTFDGFDMTQTLDKAELNSTIRVYPATATVNTTTGSLRNGTDLPVPAKEGSVFAGWYTNAELTGEVVTKALTNGKLYAKWVEAPASVTVAGSQTATAGINETYTATVLSATAPQEVVWSVSDTTVATIDAETGVLKGLKAGTVTVIATSKVLKKVFGTFDVTISFATPTGVSFRGAEEFVIGGTGKVYGMVYGANSGIADQTCTYTSSDSAVLTVDENGLVTAVAAGSASITITSSVDNTKTATKTVNVRATDYTFDVTKVLVASQYADKESFYFAGTYKTHVMGYNAFSTLEAALTAAPENAIIYVLEGTYADAATVTKNNITILGNGGIITGAINVAANVSGLTVDGLKFTDKGQVALNVKGGISNFKFINNYVYDPAVITTSAVVYFKNDGTAPNSNFVIANNVFEFITKTATDNRHIRGGNVNGITITGNTFEGIKAQYVDAVRIEGTDEKSAAGIGAAGEVVISNNTFTNIGQRAIWVTRYSATSIKVNNNVFDYAGDQNYGGAIQLQVWVAGQTTALEVNFNTFKNIIGSFGIRINNADVKAEDTWSVKVNYNKFINMADPGDYDDFIQCFSDVAKGLVNAEYNYFTDPVDDTRMSFVGSYANRFATEKELDLAVILLNADPTYGVVIAEENMETHATIAYADTKTTLAGMEWNMKEVYSSKPGDTSDLTNAATGNTRVLRFRGAYVAYLETAGYVDGLTTLAFDAKYYNSSHATSVMKVSIQHEGETTWTEVQTITLTDAYVTQYVAINETGKVKVRIDVTTKSANIDNIKLYQSKTLFTDKFNAAQ